VRLRNALLTSLRRAIKYKYMKKQSKAKFLAATVKIGLSRQVVIPKRLHDQLRLAPGDYLEVELEGERLVLTPKALVEKRLAESLEDVRKGRMNGPFESVPALLRSLHKARKTRSS
jgi:AbrB family looped-hinge helix DNA binding protein